MRADIAQAVAYTEMVAAQANHPKLKDLDWWLIHPYSVFPMDLVSRTTYDWVVSHRKFPPRSSAKFKSAMATNTSTRDMQRLAAEFSKTVASEAVDRRDAEEYFVHKGYELALTTTQLAFVIGRSDEYTRKLVNDLATKKIITKRKLKERRERLWKS